MAPKYHTYLWFGHVYKILKVFLGISSVSNWSFTLKTHALFKPICINTLFLWIYSNIPTIILLWAHLYSMTCFDIVVGCLILMSQDIKCFCPFRVSLIFFEKGPIRIINSTAIIVTLCIIIFYYLFNKRYWETHQNYSLIITV